MRSSKRCARRSACRASREGSARDDETNRMRKMILIKHAAPEVVPDVPSERWRLSEAGRQRCAPLAEAIRPHAPGLIVSSLEPKAAETGELVAARLGVAFETAEGLHEHDRSNVPHLRSREFI